MDWEFCHRTLSRAALGSRHGPVCDDRAHRGRDHRTRVEAALPGGAADLAGGGIGGAAPDRRRGPRHRGRAPAQASEAQNLQQRQRPKPMAKPKPNANVASCSTCSIRPGAPRSSLATGTSAPRSSPASPSSITIRGFPFSSGRQPRPGTCCRGEVDDDTVNARPLIRRLLAITDALQDIPRQALRLARWQAQPKEERRPERWSPLRVGRPPGFRQRAKHEVDEILKECHWLARNAEPPLDDTS